MTPSKRPSIRCASESSSSCAITKQPLCCAFRKKGTAWRRSVSVCRRVQSVSSSYSCAVWFLELNSEAENIHGFPPANMHTHRPSTPNQRIKDILSFSFTTAKQGTSFIYSFFSFLKFIFQKFNDSVGQKISCDLMQSEGNRRDRFLVQGPGFDKQIN